MVRDKGLTTAAAPDLVIRIQNDLKLWSICVMLIIRLKLCTQVDAYFSFFNGYKLCRSGGQVQSPRQEIHI